MVVVSLFLKSKINSCSTLLRRAFKPDTEGYMNNLFTFRLMLIVHPHDVIQEV